MIKDIFSSFNWGLLASLVFLVFTVLGAFPMWRKKKTRKMVFLLGFVGLILAVILSVAVPVFTSPINFGTLAIGTPSGGGQGVPSGGQVVSTFQPSATYSTMDKYSTMTISVGTSYYKENANPATTTAISNVNSGVQYTYWLSNSSEWVKPKVFVAGATNNVINKEAVTNGTATVTILNGLNGQVVSGSDAEGNVTMSANGVANIRILYQGTAKKSAGLFGGMMVIETNSTIASVTCTGNAVASGNPSGFHVTYTPSLTTHVGRLFEYTSDLDDGSGAVKEINCQFQNGGTAVSGALAPYYVKFIPANYYVSQSGEILLDTEKTADNDNTRTGSVISMPTAGTLYFA